MELNYRLVPKTISACLIVKGEADLFKCLQSIRDYVDEIIIVAGKDFKPQTKKIALQFTRKFYTYPWNDHFGDARNFSISKATCDWILIIDDDKYLTGGKVLREMSFSKQAYYARHFYVNEKGVTNCHYREIFLFKNGVGFKFCGNVHEHLVDRNRKLVADIGMLKGPVVYHTGYATDEILKQKFKRNFLLLQDGNGEPHSRKYFYLSRNYFNQARFMLQEKGKMTRAAAELLKKSMEMAACYKAATDDFKLKKDAKKLYDLCGAILLFQGYNEAEKLI